MLQCIQIIANIDEELNSKFGVFLMLFIKIENILINLKFKP